MNAAIVLPGSVVSSHKLVVVKESDAHYQILSNYVRKTYWDRFAAKPHLLPVLVALESNDEQIVTVCGLSFGSEHALFLENYLDVPVEEVLPATRQQIVEVGNLCSQTPSGGRLMIAALCRWFYDLSLSWVVFTGTTQLRNSFSRLGIDLKTLAEADPKRLGESASDWGHYYQTYPRVMAGNIADNVARLIQAGYGSQKNVLPLHLDVIYQANHETR